MPNREAQEGSRLRGAKHAGSVARFGPPHQYVHPLSERSLPSRCARVRAVECSADTRVCHARIIEEK